MPYVGRKVYFSKQLYEDVVAHYYIPPNSWDVHHLDLDVNNNMLGNLQTLGWVALFVVFSLLLRRGS